MSTAVHFSVNGHVNGVNLELSVICNLLYFFAEIQIQLQHLKKYTDFSTILSSSFTVSLLVFLKNTK